MKLKKNFLLLTAIFMVLGCNLALATSSSGSLSSSGEMSGDLTSGENASGQLSGDISGETSGETSDETSGETSGELSGDLYILESTALDSEYTTTVNVTFNDSMRASKSGDESYEFVIITDPTKGTLSQTKSGEAEFSYKPNSDYVGSDSFTFRLESGEYYSNIGTVSINIRQKAEPIIPFYYTDMQEHWANYSASHLAARGHIIGEEIGDDYFYYADKKMTRGEFMLFLLSVLGADDDSKQADINFADKESIPDWMIKKARIAYEMNLISAISDDNGKTLYLYPNAPISRAEAFVMINNALLLKTDATNVKDTTIDYTDKDNIPSWAMQAIKNLTSYKIIQGLSDKSLSPNVTTTRGEGAELCYKLVKEIEKYKLRQITSEPA